MEKLYNAHCISFPKENSLKVQSCCKSRQVFQLLKDFYDAITKICTTQVSETPVILILNSIPSQLTRELARAGLVVQILMDANFNSIDALMKNFTKKVAGFY